MSLVRFQVADSEGKIHLSIPVQPKTDNPHMIHGGIPLYADLGTFGGGGLTGDHDPCLDVARIIKPVADGGEPIALALIDTSTIITFIDELGQSLRVEHYTYGSHEPVRFLHPETWPPLQPGI